jgi:hypothetical protein
MAAMNDLVHELWGNLPPRMREQMMQNSMEQFLPKYELMIEDYFKTLADEQQDGR